MRPKQCSASIACNTPAQPLTFSRPGSGALSALFAFFGLFASGRGRSRFGVLSGPLGMLDAELSHVGLVLLLHGGQPLVDSVLKSTNVLLHQLGDHLHAPSVDAAFDEFLGVIRNKVSSTKTWNGTSSQKTHRDGVLVVGKNGGERGKEALLQIPRADGSETDLEQRFFEGVWKFVLGYERLCKRTVRQYLWLLVAAVPFSYPWPLKA